MAISYRGRETDLKKAAEVLVALGQGNIGVPRVTRRLASSGGVPSLRMIPIDLWIPNVGHQLCPASPRAITGILFSPEVFSSVPGIRLEVGEGARMNSDDLRKRASRYRAVARHVTDPETLEALRDLADKYEALADAIEARRPRQGDGASRHDCD